MNDSPRLTFLGAAGTVTGSRFLVEHGGARILVDCGLFQGLKELRLRNWERFPVDAGSIDAVVLTHAHVDHCGLLPRLAVEGFDGPVLCTQGTAALAGIVLPDSGHLQEEEAAYANRAGFSRHRPALPLFSEADARKTLRLLRTVPYGQPTALAGGMAVTFRHAGHILGSASVHLTLDTGDDPRTVVFSGDLGRGQHPLLRSPDPVGDADHILVESTYGDRDHVEPEVDVLAQAITRTVTRGGTVIIPAFAVDRTEVVLFHLRQLMDTGAIPRVPVHIDSPMALAALGVYRQALDEGWEEVAATPSGADPFDTGTLHEVRDPEGSKALDHDPHPSIIVSASGMATGGRVVHHLRARLPDHRTTVVLVGYQAAGTRGRSLADGARQLKMLGRYVPVRADIVTVDGLSVHADRDELLGWLGTADRAPDTAFVVHGEPAGSQALAGAITEDLGWCAVVPRHGESVLLD